MEKQKQIVVSVEKNVPEKKFRAGLISATVWRNQSTDGKVFATISVVKNYKDKSGEWKETNHLNQNDLPKLLVVAGKAYEHLTLGGDSKC